MREQLYRYVTGGSDFDYYKQYVDSAEQDRMRGTITQRRSDGLPVGFFVPVAPFWGAMYDTDTLYRRGAFGGTDDQLVGRVLKRRLFVPVDPCDHGNYSTHSVPAEFSTDARQPALETCPGAGRGREQGR